MGVFYVIYYLKRGLVNDLKTCHRRGLCVDEFQTLQSRKKIFGQNKQLYGESILKKSLFQQRDFIVNLLFYLITLRISVKLLLFRDELLGLHPLGQQQYHLKINAELISGFLLVFMILLKAKVSIDYYKMDQDERKYKNEKFIVKRDGERQEVQQQDIMVGDILILETNRVIRIDGIVLKSKNLIISEAHTILKQDLKSKKQIWSYCNNQKIYYNKDPFILAGSFVIGGSGQVLVCTVGPNCSFRIDKEKKGYYSQYTPTIALIKKYMTYIQQICKTVAIILATYISLLQVFKIYRDQSRNISWTDLLAILRIYCSYIGAVCFIQRLKIIKSLQFFIEANRSQKEYRIKNRSSLEYLSKLDMLFIEMSTLAVRKIQRRDQITVELDHIAEVSNINNLCQLKIITEETREEVLRTFGNDISYDYIFQPNMDVSYNNHVKSLVQSVFITQTSTQTFINEYLPIFRALKFQVGYLYDSSIYKNRQISPQIFQINFQKLVFSNMESPTLYGGYMKPNDENIRQKQTNNTLNYQFDSFSFWLKIQNKLYMEDILQRLFVKSQVYSELCHTFLTLYINSILVFISLIWFSTTVTTISLSWQLTIIISHRFMFMDIYNRITSLSNRDKILQRKSHHLITCIKLNTVLFTYYLYVVNKILNLGSLFVFFLANGLLRTEIVLNFVKPLSRRLFFRRIAGYLGICVVVGCYVVGGKWGESGFWGVVGEMQYTGGLFVIYVVYAVFM